MYRILFILLVCFCVCGCTRTAKLEVGDLAESFAEELRGYEVGKPVFDPANPLVQRRIVFISGHLNFSVAQTVCETLAYLDQQSKTEPIKLIISSGGGDGFAYMTIANMVKSLEAPVDTINISFCGSAAVCLFLSATGQRYALEDSYFMIHDVQGQPKEIRETFSKFQEELFRSKCEFPSDWLPLKDQEFLFSAAEAKEYKVVDEVLEAMDL